MAKRKTPAAGGNKADAAVWLADKPGTSFLRQLLAYFSQDRLQRDPRAQDDVKIVRLALQHLAAGNAEEAVFLAMSAADAAVWLAVDPYVHREGSRIVGKQRKAAEFNRKVDDAKDRLATLLNGNSRMSYTAKLKKAAADAGIGWRAFYNHLPAYLKRSE